MSPDRRLGGFTIVEMLVCTLIMALASAVILQTLSLGIRQFQARTRESEARLLCDTLALAVRDRLACVGDVEYIDRNGVREEYYHYLTGLKESADYLFSIAESDGTLVVCYYDKNDVTALSVRNGRSAYPLISQADYAKGGDLQAHLDQLVWNDGQFKVRLSVTSRTQKIQEVVSTFTVVPVLGREVRSL